MADEERLLQVFDSATLKACYLRLRDFEKGRLRGDAFHQSHQLEASVLLAEETFQTLRNSNVSISDFE